MIAEYTLNGEDVRQIMLETMEKHLRLKTEGYRRSTKQSFHLLLKAVAEGSSLEAVCADRCGALTADPRETQAGTGAQPVPVANVSTAGRA